MKTYCGVKVQFHALLVLPIVERDVFSRWSIQNNNSVAGWAGFRVGMNTECRQFTYNVKMMRVRVTTVALEKQ